MSTDIGKVAQELESSTPDAMTVAKALGEENLRGTPEGKWEVRAVDKHGAPDPKKARLLREIYTNQSRAEERLNYALNNRPRRSGESFMTFVEFSGRTRHMTAGEIVQFKRRLADANCTVLPRGME